MNQKLAHEELLIARAEAFLNLKGELDQHRHKSKVKAALRQQLSDVICDESLIVSNGQHKVKIALHGLEEYRFRYSDSQTEGANGWMTSADSDHVNGGHAHGEWMTEQAVNIEEIEQQLFDELALPDCVKEDIRISTIGNVGMLSNIDKKRSLLAAIKQGNKFTRESLRFKTWDVSERVAVNAAVLFMMDISGSMGPFEKMAARTFFFWLSRILKHRYKYIEFVFIAHHTEAREVDEQTFFQLSENGGTLCSTAYRKANEIIDARYPRDQYNVFAIHFSDGDNLHADNETCLREVTTLIDKCSLLSYGEVNTYRRTSSLMQTFTRNIRESHLKTFTVREKSDILQALKTCFETPREGRS